MPKVSSITSRTKFDAVEQSHAITQIDEICRAAKLPSYTGLLLISEQAAPLLLSPPQRKSFMELAEEYVSSMLRDFSLSEEERSLLSEQNRY